MTRQDVPTPAELKHLVLQILDENRVMSVATLRPDGWPQTTIVGYVHDGLTLYFAAARGSQKLGNIARDPRTSIAVGHRNERAASVRGLSMAAHAAQVSDWREVDRLNGLIRERYPEVDVFAPRDSNAVVVRASPLVVSVVDDEHGISQPQLAQITEAGDLRIGAPGTA